MCFMVIKFLTRRGRGAVLGGLMAELMTVIFSFAFGIVLAGLLTSAVEMFTAQKTGFGMLFSGKSAVMTLAITLFIMVSGPVLLARFVPEFFKRREPAGVSMMAAGTFSWGFVTGLLALSAYFSIV